MTDLNIIIYHGRIIQDKVTELLNIERIITTADVALFEHDETMEVSF